MAGKKGWFKKIPTNIILSPIGMVLVCLALIMEITDILPGGALTFEMIPEIIFVFLLWKFAKVPLKASIIPFVIERIPGISDVLPTWIIRLLV